MGSIMPLQLLLTFVIVSLTAIVAVLWLVRIRAAWRLRAAANAYAEREIAREARWQSRQKKSTHLGREGALVG